jgi:4-amino-4-deoxy-L-arabinose transferase-like glycosyltransferase
VTISGPDNVLSDVSRSALTNLDARAGSLAAVADPDSNVLSGWARRLGRSPWIWTALVILLFGLPLFIGLGGTDFENDEAFHSLVVDTMAKEGDWLTPKHPFQSPFLEKPPLKFWIVALPIRLGLLPADEFGMRFWDAIIATVAFLYVFAIGRRLGGPVCGLGALLILFAHQPLLFDHGLRSNNMEAALSLSYCGGVYYFLAWKSGAGATRRRHHVFAIAAFFALGFMVKFVAVLFLPLVFGAVTLFSPGARSRLRSDWRAWLGASGLAVALVVPWFLYQLHHSGRFMWDVIFGQQVVTRFTAYLDPAHLHPWHFYWSSIFHELSISGAVTICVLGVALLLIQAARKSLGGERAVILVWFVLPLALMSLMTSKLYHYAYPYLAPVALAGGYGAAVIVARAWSLAARPSSRLDAMLEQRLAIWRGRTLRMSFVIVAVIAVAVAIATHAAGPLRLTVGGVTLFRNANALRAWLVALLMLTLAGYLGVALRAGLIGLLMVALLPASGYTRSLARLPVQAHPLRSIGQCLQAVTARSRPGEVAGGIWIEGAPIAHFYFYYFRGLGSWQERRGGSDPTAYMHLYVPSMRTPVLQTIDRYQEFIRVTRTEERVLLDRVARKTGLDAATVKADADQASVTTVRFPREVLMLPGPFAPCAAAYGREAGR